MEVNQLPALKYGDLTSAVKFSPPRDKAKRRIKRTALCRRRCKPSAGSCSNLLTDEAGNGTDRTIIN
ncbi:unnamed protein product, partial [Iphiclides podalirius]